MVARPTKKSPWREHRVPRRQERNLSINFATDTAAITLPSLRATKFEFEKRFWIICAIYFAGFCLSAVDHTPFIVALRHLIAPSIARGSADADTFARVVITIGALLVFLSAALRTWGARLICGPKLFTTLPNIRSRSWRTGRFVTREIRFISRTSRWQRESVFSRRGRDY